jgi:retron-type reverse transcriptase
LWEARKLYQRPHLPQGAPSSPALANICAWRIDRRLARLAEAAGAAYTRYADDLAFSGDDRFESSVERFSLHVAAILLEEGFRANHRKTRIMRRGVRQYLTGMVANDRVNVVRPDFDRLKATLNNCVRRGPQNENRNGHTDFRAHLLGRVGFVESINPEKGNRLRRIFEQIQW